MWCDWVGHAVVWFAFSGWGLIALVPQIGIVVLQFPQAGEHATWGRCVSCLKIFISIWTNHLCGPPPLVPPSSAVWEAL